MRTPRVFVALDLRTGGTIELPADTAHYLLKVLRRRPGDPVVFFNGEGGQYAGRLLASPGRPLRAEIAEFAADDREPPLRLVLAQGISRGAHMDYTLQKAVELGVNRIVAVSTEFANVKLDEERAEKRLAHWRGIVIAACEQSGRNRLPEVRGPEGFADWITQEAGALRLLLEPSGTQALRTLDRNGRDVVVLSGPEGGFADFEVKAALSRGYAAVRLGPRVLRTETAAVAAIAACQALWGDLG